MSTGKRPPLPAVGIRLAPRRAIELCRLWACRFAPLGLYLSALLFVALWAFFELLRLWAMEGAKSCPH